ncbi:MAG: hypothetical protein BIFFINMI_02427 [Phycisphaerae bacterium]|nr:hypothetical protein [Phycisphaerae bacterium]
MAYVVFTLVSLIWGASFILMKRGELCLTPVTIAAARVAGGAAVLALIWWLGRGGRIARRDLPPILVVVLAGYAYPFVAQPMVIRALDSSFAGMMVTGVPLMTILLSAPMLGVLPSRRQLIGVLGGLLFFGLILYDRGARPGGSPLYILVGALVPVCYAISNTYIRRRFVHVSPLVLTCLALSGAAVLFAPFAAAHPLRAGYLRADLPLSVGAILVLGVVGTGLAQFMFYRLIRDHGPLFAGMVTYLIPVTAVAIGWLDGERVTPLQLFSLCGVLAMVIVVQWGGAGGRSTRPISKPILKVKTD